MCLFAIVSILAVGVAGASADSPGNTRVFPVTLADGGPILSLGDPARLGDMLALSVLWGSTRPADGANW